MHWLVDDKTSLGAQIRLCRDLARWPAAALPDLARALATDANRANQEGLAITTATITYSGV